MKRTQRYRPQMWFGWALILIGIGLHSTLRAEDSVARAIGFGVLAGVGIGWVSPSTNSIMHVSDSITRFEYSTTVFPVQAPLSVEQNAPALAFLQFLRSFASVSGFPSPPLSIIDLSPLTQVWGVTIGAAVLQNELQHRVPPAFHESFPQGAAIAYALIPQIPSLAQPLKHDVQDAFAQSLQVLWKVLIGVSAIGFLSSLLMEGLPLHGKLDKTWAPGSASTGSDEKHSLSDAAAVPAHATEV